MAEDTATTNAQDVEIADGVITSAEVGTYLVSGTLMQGRIVVDADKIQIVLDNASIHCEESAAIYIKSADKVWTTLAEGGKTT